MKNTSILFVCLGNICRSPMAEGIMQFLVDKNGLNNKISLDSAGMISVHQGQQPDKRIQEAGLKRGYKLNHQSRPVKSSDFENFDIIIGMDDSNIDGLISKAPSLEAKQKIHRMADYFSSQEIDHVPDPYYGGARGFDLVIDLLEDACINLLKEISEK